MAVRAPSFTAYSTFKYIVYCLLVLNIYLFFLEDHAAAAEVFVTGVTWATLIEAYSASIDTFAWVILLLMFELETAVIPDKRLEGSLKWVLASVRGLAFAVITLAFYGYCAKYISVSDLVAFDVVDPCTLIGAGYTYVTDLDKYPPIDANSCLALRGEFLQRIDGTQILGTASELTAASRLAFVDIINSGTWLVVVIVLELEVFLHLTGRLTDKLIRANTYVKSVLYSILFLCAVYWGVLGDFLDFWDAFLWLIAFVFIELNIFEWHKGSSQREAPA